MQYQFFTLPFLPDTENFDDTEFQQFLKEVNVVSVTDQFFIYENTPYWGILVRYLPPTGEKRRPKTEREEAYKEKLEQADWPLFEKLREWRKGEADKIHQPVYIVFDNMKLATIAHARPKTVQSLHDLKLGEKRIEKYGKAILDIVKAFEEHPNAG